MAGEYHWNDHTGDLLTLLDSNPLPPLDGFDSNSFAPQAPLTDFFSHMHAEPSPNTVVDQLEVPHLMGPLSDSSSIEPAVPKFEQSLQVPHSYVDAGVTVQLTADQVLEVSSPIDVASPIDVSSPIDAASPSPPDGPSVSERDYSSVLPSVVPNAVRTSSEANNSSEPASISSAASDITTNALSAVEAAKKAAEDFANSKVSERKRKLGGVGADGKRRKGNDGAQCSDDDGNDDDAPEKVSHRKYQKRLQKNRDSAYVSRIRRREYTKRLEDGLNRVENEKIELQSRYDALQQKFEVVVQELKTLKDATAAKFKALAAPVGAARQTAAVVKPKNAGAIVTTMFMCALIFGFIMPDSLTPRSPFSAANGVSSGINFGAGGNGNQRFQMTISSGGNKREDKGRVWQKLGPVAPPKHWDLSGSNAMQSLSNNITQVFGNDNGVDLVDILQKRIEMGAVTGKQLLEMKEKAQLLVENMQLEQVKRTLPSRRSQLFKKVLRKLANLADECFTKEVIALLTIRILPGEATRFTTTTRN